MRPVTCRTAAVRLLTLLVLGVVLATGAAVAAGTSPAWADPAPTPGVGVPDPGVPPSPDKTPTPPKPTPSPIPGPPTGKPTPAPPGTPSPAPGPTPPGFTPPSPDDNNDPGLFDIPGQIRKAINDFIAWIAKTGLKPVLDALGHTVLSTPNLTANPQVKAHLDDEPGHRQRHLRAVRHRRRLHHHLPRNAAEQLRPEGDRAPGGGGRGRGQREPDRVRQGDRGRQRVDRRHRRPRRGRQRRGDRA